MQPCWLQSAVCMYGANLNAANLKADFNLLSVSMQQYWLVCCLYVCSKSQCWLRSSVCKYAAMVALACCLYVCRIVNDLLTAMDNNKICILTLLDLSAAFDAIDHQILLTRLQHSFGICGSALSWFSSYLYNRTHAVTINNLQSQQTTLHYGIPQGSVLGPMFFILYTQPLFNLVNKHAVNHHAFADDNQLYNISTLVAIHQSIETLQNCATGFSLLVVSMQQCWLQSAVCMYAAMLASVFCLYVCSNAGCSLLSVCMQQCWLQSSVCMYAAMLA